MPFPIGVNRILETDTDGLIAPASRNTAVNHVGVKSSWPKGRE